MESIRDAIENSVLAVIRARYGWSPDIDDLLVIAREAVNAVLSEGAVLSFEQQMRYSIRRARCRAVDYLRKQKRSDPMQRIREITFKPPKEPTLPINARVPIPLKARLHVVSMKNGWSLSQALRKALDAGLRSLEQ